ncbi:MAG: hypothetical protein PF483_02710 [Halothiobacillus sp.]|jgi:hypothetical protein|uniref:hypothetical protein n=1 Tax=Halothiobacillus sp. TaxID=1891311 RepID=UPI002AD339D3|nr:hypothetical protein [Halothiobacillus sp.]MDA3875980.1 hypothetical protein [Halothiobacillus sp.]
MDHSTLIKQREIRFRGPHHHGDQSSGASAFICHLPGVIKAERLDAWCLGVHYDVQKICLRVILRHLQLAGFHLDASLLVKLKLALIEYAEQNERELLGLESCPMPTRPYRPSAEHLTAQQHKIRPPAIPERSDDPWRHYL